jgi:hypothetical protein
MELLNGVGSGELITLVVLAVVLLGILALLRIAFKLTATVFKLGCAIVFLIVAGAAVFMFLL